MRILLVLLLCFESNCEWGKALEADRHLVAGIGEVHTCETTRGDELATPQYLATFRELIGEQGDPPNQITARMATFSFNQDLSIHLERDTREREVLVSPVIDPFTDYQRPVCKAIGNHGI